MWMLIMHSLKQGSGWADGEKTKRARDEAVGVTFRVRIDELAPKVLPKRSTRGKRFVALVGEDAEKDKSFWEHETWDDEKADSDSDGEYQYTAMKDIIDSDFDLTEDESEDDGAEKEAALRRAARKAKRRTGYVDKMRLKKKQKIGSQKGRGKAQAKAKAPPRRPRAPVVMRQRVFRSSTTARVAQSEAQRKEEQDKSLLRKEIRVAAAKGAPVKERLVQAELLREAAHTEIANRRSLELMLSFESERVRKKPVPPPYRGPSYVIIQSLVPPMSSRSLVSENFLLRYAHCTA